jgi:hypothetical protein
VHGLLTMPSVTWTKACVCICCILFVCCTVSVSPRYELA